jgi:predicted  nucleic acid-binding Zn-ribbon protein
LESGEEHATASQIAELRALIPQHILRNYDRMRVHGKKGIAVVRNHVCTNCRLQVPIAITASLMTGTLSPVCGNCGRYLCLPETTQTEPVEVPAAIAPSRVARPKMAAANLSR